MQGELGNSLGGAVYRLQVWRVVWHRWEKLLEIVPHGTDHGTRSAQGEG